MINNLSEDLKQKTFNFLHYKDWSIVAQLSKQWSDLTKKFTTKYLQKASFDDFKEAFVNSVKQGNIALFRTCIAAERLEDVKTIIQTEESNEDITEEELGSGSLLFQAVLLGNVEMIDYLIAAGASVSGFATYGEEFANKVTPLYAAWKRDNYDIAQFLILKGATIYMSSSGISSNLACPEELYEFLATASNGAFKVLRGELDHAKQEIKKLEKENSKLKAKLMNSTDTSDQFNTESKKRKLIAEPSAFKMSKP